jgi:hypothetical protein
MPNKHNGADFTKQGGAYLDLRSPLYAIAKGKIVYFQKRNTGYGNQVILRIDGPWGIRWARYAHCDPYGFPTKLRDVEEGEQIATIGNTGNSTAPHLHFEIVRVDPGAFLGDINRVPKDICEMTAYWEDPISFLKQWMNVSGDCPEPVITDQTIIPQLGNMRVYEIKSQLDKLAAIRNMLA